MAEIKKQLVQGAGGGGKGKGGRGRVAVESPNTLQSKQYARVLDLLSEGEIKGLVNGMKSIYLDETPIQNADNTYNFSGVVFDSRNGTQIQSPINGFTQTEAETSVGTEIKKNVSVTRTVSNSNNTSLRVTVSLPALTYQNTSNGDLSGSSVELAIDVQNNGGGFVAQPLRIVQSTADFVIDNAGIGKNVVDSNKFSIEVGWTGVSNIPGSFNDTRITQTATVELQYRLVGSSTWLPLEQHTFSGRITAYQRQNTYSYNSFAGIVTVPMTGFGAYSTGYAAPAGTRTFNFAPSKAKYEFRVVQLNGYGTSKINSGIIDIDAYTDIISGKTISRYQKSYTIALPASGPWDIRLRRITDDATTANIQNKTYWDSYTEIIDAKLRYPNSAICGIEVDAQQFNNIPTRGYEIDGLLIKVPVNYDPITRVYSGAWNGTFKTAWTNNPAWVFYDLVTTDRYGLGEFISESQVDKWALYQIAQYCDEMIDDGFGASEPRFTVNLYLQTREEAYRVLNNLASSFRAINYWANGSVTTVQDAPSDAIALFTAANVIDGAFNYQGSSARTRHTVALVSWNDPEDSYAQKIEYVADDEGIARYGVQQTDVVAFGCTSRGQAHRFGKSILYTERMESEVISFRTGLDGAMVYPGAVIQTHDVIRAGKRFGGRVTLATDADITLDAEVTIEAGKNYELSCVLPDGTIESKIVTTAASTTNTLHVSPAFSQAPQADAVWILAANDLIPESWRVISVSEIDKTMLEVTAMAYRADKYDAIESDITLVPLPISTLKASSPDTPVGLSVSESLYVAALGVVGVKATASWNIVNNATEYVLEYVGENGNPVTITTSNTTIDIQPIAEGTYTFSVRAVNVLGRKSQSSSINKTIYGKTLPPEDVQNFQLSAINGAGHFTFTPSQDIDVQVGGYLTIKHSSLLVGATWNNAIEIGERIPGNASSAVIPLLSGTYFAKWFDSSGNESVNATSIVTNAPDLLNMNVVETITENPAWLGNKTNICYLPSQGGLVLDSENTIGEMLTNISTWPKFGSLGGISHLGEYLAENIIDLGDFYTSRITASILSAGFDSGDYLSARTDLISLWPSISGDVITNAFVKLYIRTTEDDPNASPTWSDWSLFYVGDWAARAYQFKVEFTSNAPTENVALQALSISIDMPDRFDSGDNIASGAGIKHVTYNLNFKAVKALAVTAENMATGDIYLITNKTANGFDIEFKNSSGSAISRTFDYISRGY